MIQKLGIIFQFYRPLFFLSMGVNIALTILSPQLGYIFIIKFMLAFLALHISHINGQRRRINFFRSKGFSTLSLFGLAYVIDALITAFYLLFIQEFV